MKGKTIRFLSVAGMSWFIPLVRLATGEDPLGQLKSLAGLVLGPAAAVVLFAVLWGAAASRIDTSLGTLPGPGGVMSQLGELAREHREERRKEQAFIERQKKRNAEILSQDPDAEVKIRDYTGKPTYLDQIVTSLKTVFMGFVLASLVALPLGILCGMSPAVMNAVNPLVQVFKPVSPLAWLPIVTMIVSALYVTKDGLFEKSFIISAITVSLCSLWPSLINTALGVASVDKDYLNVARVLKLGWFQRVWKIILPASLPLVFTGLRISLGVGWMVLIAAEMLAQNPGLGKFVWDEFQNGSSHSLARIMAAVLTIGGIGFFLDRVMVVLQKLVRFGDEPMAA